MYVVCVHFFYPCFFSKNVENIDGTLKQTSTFYITYELIKFG